MDSLSALSSTSLPRSSASTTQEVSMDSFHPCPWRPASPWRRMLSGPRWVCSLYTGRQEMLGWPSTYVDKIWGINTPVSSLVSGSTPSPRGSSLELSPASSMVTSPTGVSWDHLLNNLFVPKSLILVGTLTKPSPKHQSCLQADSRRAESGPHQRGHILIHRWPGHHLLTAYLLKPVPGTCSLRTRGTNDGNPWRCLTSMTSLLGGGQAHLPPHHREGQVLSPAPQMPMWGSGNRNWQLSLG